MEEDTYFGMSGPLGDVLDALDASIAAFPTGGLLVHKTWLRAQIAASSDLMAGCVVSRQQQQVGVWTYSVSWWTADAITATAGDA